MFDLKRGPGSGRQGAREIDRVPEELRRHVLWRILGIGERYHPLPWSTLEHDTRQGGYVVGLAKEQLERAPTFGREESPAWGNRAYESKIHDYYEAPPYWSS